MKKNLTFLISVLFVLSVAPAISFALEEYPSESDPAFLKEQAVLSDMVKQIQNLLNTIAKRGPSQDTELYDPKSRELCISLTTDTSGSNGGLSYSELREALNQAGYKVGKDFAVYTKELKEAVRLLQTVHANSETGPLDKGSGLIGPETRKYLNDTYGCARSERVERRKAEITSIYTRLLRRLPTNEELNRDASSAFTIVAIEKDMAGQKDAVVSRAGVYSSVPSLTVSISQTEISLGESVTVRWLARNITAKTVNVYVTRLSKLDPLNINSYETWATIALGVPTDRGYFVWNTGASFIKPSTKFVTVVPATDYLFAVEAVADGKTVRSEINNSLIIKDSVDSKKISDKNAGNSSDSTTVFSEAEKPKPTDGIKNLQSAKNNPVPMTEQQKRIEVATPPKSLGFFGRIIQFFKSLFQ